MMRSISGGRVHPKLVRSTTAVLVVTAGLFVCQGPIATADTTTNEPASANTITPAVATPDQPEAPSTPLSTGQGPTSTFGSGREPGDQPEGIDLITTGTTGTGTTPTDITPADTIPTDTVPTDTTPPFSEVTPETPTSKTESAAPGEVTAQTGSVVTAAENPTEVSAQTNFGSMISEPSPTTTVASTESSGSSSNAAATTSVTATAPVVSTTVDASPPATVEKSPLATSEAVQSGVVDSSPTVDVDAAEPTVDVPVDAAAAGADPAAIDDAAATEVVPPTAACIAASNCMTVLQAMFSSVARAVIAPLTSIDSWFGTVWYQRDSTGVPRQPNQGGSAGVPSSRSLLLPVGYPTVLRQNDTHGPTVSAKIGETVRNEITALDEPTPVENVSSPRTITSTAATPAGHAGILGRVVHALMSTPTLMVLAMAALPGLGGFLAITASGMRLGYRQAKAGFALRSSGLTRYVRPTGPIGVVRSGSQIALRPRPARLPTCRILKEVA